MEEKRLNSLNIESKRPPKPFSKNYSVFVRLMRYLLPIIAIILTVGAFIWPQLKDDLTIIEKEDLGISDTMQIGKTELISPNFETIDSNNNPVQVRAIKATQDQINPKLIQLEEPNADLITKEGDALNVQSDLGTYEQETEKLYLQKNVIMVHEEGYILNAEELRLNMQTQEAFSDKNISIKDDDTIIQATGVEGSMKDGILTFKGPATLIWHETKKEITVDNVEQ